MSARSGSLLCEPPKIRAAAHLYWEAGHVYRGKRDPITATIKYRRALELFLEARALEPTEQDTSAVLELSRLIAPGELDARYRAG